MQKVFSISFLFLMSFHFAASAQFDNKNLHSNTRMANDSSSIHKKFVDNHTFFFSAGYGLIYLGMYQHFDLQNNSNSPSVTGPVYVKIETKINPKTTIACNIAYVNASRSETLNTAPGKSSGGNYLHKYSSLSIAARINWHFNNVNSHIDTYFGLGMGYAKRIEEWTSGSTTLTSIHRRGRGGQASLPPLPIAGEATFGTAIKIHNGLFGFFEVGFAKSILQGGLQYRM